MWQTTREKDMTAQLTNQQKKDWAKLLYLQGDTDNKDIAEKVGVSRNTITRWAKDENWEMLRAAVTSTREEQIRNMYHQIAQINKSIAESDTKYATSAQADAINKLASAISKLEGDYGIADIISVSKQMLTWMRRKDAAKAVEMSEWFDEFIKEKLR